MPIVSDTSNSLSFNGLVWTFKLLPSKHRDQHMQC